YEGIAVESHSPKMQAVSYDSTKGGPLDTGNPLAPVFAAHIGKSFTFTVDPRGEVTKVVGIKQLLADVAATVSVYPSSGVVMDGLKRNISDETMAVSLRRVLTGLPDKAVKAGDTWTDNFDLPIVGGGSFKTERTFTLKDVSKTDAGKLARITG